MRHIATAMLLLLSAALHLVSCSEPPHVDSLWNGRTFGTAHEIITLYDSIEQHIENNSTLQTKNLCHYVWNSGEYMLKCRGKNNDIVQLPQHISRLSFDDRDVEQFMVERDTARFADHYFMLQAMKRGDSFDNSRDGLTITVFFKARAINDNDYRKLHEVFSSSNAPLHEAYLRKLIFLFHNSGCTQQLCEIKPLIEKNVAESPIKARILSQYEEYEPLMPGSPAPTPTLKDKDNKEYTFAQFRGKILVIDVWATWCSSCLHKMPTFLQLREEFKDNDNVDFITVSIDRSNARNSWLKAIIKNNMQGITNLFPDCPVQSQFESEYKISGVPRYIVIDKNGDLVNAYAPSPGEGLKEIIEKHL